MFFQFMCTSGYGQEFLLGFLVAFLSFFETRHICVLVFYYALSGEKNENPRPVLHLVKPEIMGFLHELGRGLLLTIPCMGPYCGKACSLGLFSYQIRLLCIW